MLPTHYIHHRRLLLVPHSHLQKTNGNDRKLDYEFYHFYFHVKLSNWNFQTLPGRKVMVPQAQYFSLFSWFKQFPELGRPDPCKVNGVEGKGIRKNVTGISVEHTIIIVKWLFLPILFVHYEVNHVHLVYESVMFCEVKAISLHPAFIKTVSHMLSQLFHSFCVVLAYFLRFHMVLVLIRRASFTNGFNRCWNPCRNVLLKEKAQVVKILLFDETIILPTCIVSWYDRLFCNFLFKSEASPNKLSK